MFTRLIYTFYLSLFSLYFSDKSNVYIGCIVGVRFTFLPMAYVRGDRKNTNATRLNVASPTGAALRAKQSDEQHHREDDRDLVGSSQRQVHNSAHLVKNGMSSTSG